MKKILLTAVTSALIMAPYFGAYGLTIKSGEVLTTNPDGTQSTVPFHETASAKKQIEEKGYAILGNNVAIAGLDVTLTVDEALELVRNGLVDADLPADVKEVLQDLNDADLQNAVELLDSGQITVDDIQNAIDAGCVGNAECDYVPEGLQD